MIKIKYHEVNYKYELDESFTVELKEFKGISFLASPYIECHEGALYITVGWKWDGASGPAVDTDSIMRAACVHDALYEALRQGVIPQKKRKAADKVLYRLCREDGMRWTRAQWVYRAVRWGGADAAKVIKNLEWLERNE